MNPDQQPQQWWKTCERILVQELKFDQHLMNLCVFMCTEASTNKKVVPSVSDEILVIRESDISVINCTDQT